MRLPETQEVCRVWRIIQSGSSIRSLVDLNDNDKNAYVIIRAFITHGSSAGRPEVGRTVEIQLPTHWFCQERERDRDLACPGCA